MQMWSIVCADMAQRMMDPKRIVNCHVDGETQSGEKTHTRNQRDIVWKARDFLIFAFSPNAVTRKSYSSHCL
jgi:hypothetical protein